MARASRQQAREVGRFASALALGPSEPVQLVESPMLGWPSRQDALASVSGRRAKTTSPLPERGSKTSVRCFRPPDPRPRPGLSLRDQARLGSLVDDSRFTPQDVVVLGDE